MSKKIRILIIIVALITAGVSGYNLITHYLELHRGDVAYESIREIAIVEVEEKDDEPEPEKRTYNFIEIDFDALAELNTDIVGWLYIHDTPVSYPILLGRDNQYYLNTTYDRKSNVLGSIFQDYRNDVDLKDPNTIIYGHNTRNDSMFGSLKKYKEQEYADEHLEVCVIRKEGVYVYEIFTVYETAATSDTYTIRFASSESFDEYIKNMAAQTLVNAADPPEGENIVTLSTCTGGQKIMRLVLQAKYIDFVSTTV